MSQPLDKVQAFWLGPMSTMERLVIGSYVAHGHEFHLYSYEEIDGLPPGAVLKDAEEILPFRSRYRDSRGTFAGFSDAFRYKLLLDRGGWWVDMDAVCIAPFDFDEEYVFGLEPDMTMAAGVIRVPPDSEVMRYAWERSQAARSRWRRITRRPLAWGEIGPPLLAEAVEACGLSEYAVQPGVFYPFDWPEWDIVLKPGVPFPEEAKSIHLWNGLWTVKGGDKDATYPQDCIYEQLKRRYLPSSG